MTEPLTFTIERGVRPDSTYSDDLCWSDGGLDYLTSIQGECLKALQARAAEPDLPDGFALTPTADVKAALAAVRTGKWTAHHHDGVEVDEGNLHWYVEHRPDARFHMRPVSPPMVRVGDGDLPADASDDEIVAAFRAQGGA